MYNPHVYNLSNVFVYNKKKYTVICEGKEMQRLTSETLIGKTVKEAEEYIKKNDVFHDDKNDFMSIDEIRVIDEDGEGLMMSMDYDNGRLNVETIDGIIVQILYIG